MASILRSRSIITLLSQDFFCFSPDRARIEQLSGRPRPRDLCTSFRQQAALNEMVSKRVESFESAYVVPDTLIKLACHLL